MPDVQWSNESLPPPKAGLSTPVKVALGCGLLMLVAGGSCVALTLAGVTKVTHAVTGMGEAEWPIVKKVTDQLTTDEGAQAAWGAYPKLSSTFTDRDDFLREMTALRPFLEPLPEERPPLMSGKVGMSYNSRNDQSQVVMTYRTQLGASLIFTFENSQLTNIQLERPRAPRRIDVGSTGSSDPLP